MAVKRIVTNIHCENSGAAKLFYGEILEMEIVMDLGWIMTLASDATTPPQLSFASEGGSGTSVPDLSIEVDNFSVVYQKMVDAGYRIEYGPVTEPWGVQRFYVRDPFGRLVNILSHV